MNIGQHSSLKKSARILMVDDNRHGLLARRAILESHGYTVIAKQCPKAALNCFESEQFDLLITDFRMPGMSGLHLIRVLRESRPGTPIILMSSVADPLGLDQDNTGADVVIQKSANEDRALLRAVERLLAPPAARKPAGRQRSTSSRSRLASNGL